MSVARVIYDGAVHAAIPIAGGIALPDGRIMLLPGQLRATGELPQGPMFYTSSLAPN